LEGIVRLFNRHSFEQAQREWRAGEYGPEWEPFRLAAAHQGFIHPPGGERFDSRDDQFPSRRAIVWRAIEDNPRALMRIINRSRSWTEVVAGIIELEGRIRSEIDEQEREVAVRRVRDPERNVAAESLGQIMRRIAHG
jgi:hypothetical protein